eukprot:352922-Pyramimonas_sp.AAC.1
MLHIHYINIKVCPCQGCFTSITSTSRCARVKDASHPLHQQQGAPVSRMRHIHYINIKDVPVSRMRHIHYINIK